MIDYRVLIVSILILAVALSLPEIVPSIASVIPVKFPLTNSSTIKNVNSNTLYYAWIKLFEVALAFVVLAIILPKIFLYIERKAERS